MESNPKSGILGFFKYFWQNKSRKTAFIEPRLEICKNNIEHKKWAMFGAIRHLRHGEPHGHEKISIVR